VIKVVHTSVLTLPPSTNPARVKVAINERVIGANYESGGVGASSVRHQDGVLRGGTSVGLSLPHP
jgi:hypothetical protein